MRHAFVVATVAFACVASATSCAKPAAPVTTCTGPKVDDASPIERLPFHGDGLDPSCQAGPDIVDKPASAAAVRAEVAGGFEDLGAALACDQPPSSLDVDFTHEEVLVLDFADDVAIDGVFDAGGGTLVVAASADESGGATAAAKAKFTRALSVIERTGDIDVAVRTCVTTAPVDD